MKHFLEKVLEWKSASCLMFTGSVIIFMVIAFFMGYSSVSVLTLLSLLIMSAVGTLLQYLFFTDLILKNVKYTARLILFAASFLVLLSACAYIFNWLPIGFGSWVLFGIIFFVVLFGITLGFEIFFRITGRRYDGILGQYKKTREEKDNK